MPSSADAVLLLLADQAAVTVEDLRRMIGVWRRQPHCIVAARYDSIVGVPAIFPRADYAALAGLRGDQGARVLLCAATQALPADAYISQGPAATKELVATSPRANAQARFGLATDNMSTNLEQGRR